MKPSFQIWSVLASPLTWWGALRPSSCPRTVCGIPRTPRTDGAPKTGCENSKNDCLSIRCRKQTMSASFRGIPRTRSNCAVNSLSLVLSLNWKRKRTLREASKNLWRESTSAERGFPPTGSHRKPIAGLRPTMASRRIGCPRSLMNFATTGSAFQASAGQSSTGPQRGVTASGK